MSISNSISSSSANELTEITGGVAAVSLVVSLTSIVNFVDSTVVPFLLTSTVGKPDELAVLRLDLTFVSVQAQGTRHFALSVPAVIAVVSSDSAMVNTCGALSIAAATNALVATEVSLSPAAGVGAVGLPVNAGLANGAFAASSPCTYAVLAAFVLLSAAAGVGTVTVPVNVGLASGALVKSPVST